MAKAKKRIATRKKASKRGKANAKPARKKVAKRTTPKKAKSKVRQTQKSKPKKKRSPKTKTKMPRQSMPVVEDTIVDVIDEPVPGVVRVREYETIRTTAPQGGGSPETEE